MTPRPTLPLAAAVLALALSAAMAGPARAQDVRPLVPILEPAGPGRSGPATERADSIVLPLPSGPRAEAARLARARVTVVPGAWSDLSDTYDPHWIGPSERPSAFGLARWSTWFAARGIAPYVDPHPFFGPWGLYSYEGRLLDLYRSAWAAPVGEGPAAEAGEWLRRGDGAMAAGRVDEAVTAYRRATVAGPPLPHAWLALGAALAEGGDDREAARAIRQGLDRFPAWLPLAVDWTSLLSGERLGTALDGAAARARTGDAESLFVAGVLHLFGERPAEGRALLAALAGDPHVDQLVARGPRP